MHGSLWWSEEVCVGATAGTRWVVAVEQFGKVGRCLVVEGFLSEEE